MKETLSITSKSIVAGLLTFSIVYFFEKAQGEEKIVSNGENSVGKEAVNFKNMLDSITDVYESQLAVLRAEINNKVDEDEQKTPASLPITSAPGNDRKIYESQVVPQLQYIDQYVSSMDHDEPTTLRFREQVDGWYNDLRGLREFQNNRLLDLRDALDNIVYPEKDLNAETTVATEEDNADTTTERGDNTKASEEDAAEDDDKEDFTDAKNAELKKILEKTISAQEIVRLQNYENLQNEIELFLYHPNYKEIITSSEKDQLQKFSRKLVEAFIKANLIEAERQVLKTDYSEAVENLNFIEKKASHLTDEDKALLRRKIGEIEDIVRNKMEHKVEEGETLTGIAEKYGVELDELKNLNKKVLKGKNNDKIKPGMILQIRSLGADSK